MAYNEDSWPAKHPGGSVADVEPEIGPLLVQICRAQRNLASAALDALDMHVGQEHLVYRLAAEEGVSQSQLAGALCLDASTVTKMLLRLERDGVVTRRADANDARVQRVYLTPRGKTLVKPALDVWSELEARITQGMSQAEVLLLRRLLLQVLGNLS
jgi:MarR family transcriptional regulator, organic hydroperoxide resistance regulator